MKIGSFASKCCHSCDTTSIEYKLSFNPDAQALVESPLLDGYRLKRIAKSIGPKKCLDTDNGPLAMKAKEFGINFYSGIL